MIDFLKIEINNILLIEKIRRNQLLIYKSETEKVNSKTGELYFINNYTYRKLTFTIITDSYKKAKKLYISGSLHYYFNDGLHNANDFSFVNLGQVINDLKGKFDIEPLECTLRSVEFGINIIPSKYEVRQILQNTMYHQRKKFLEPINKPYKQAGNPRQNDFIVKIYNKGFQFPKYVNGELLRFEVKYMRMRELNKIGIVKLSDLMIKENHLKLYKVLLLRFSEILLFDFTINSKKLTLTMQKNLINYANPIYWENIISKSKNRGKHRNTFLYHKKRLKNITKLYSENIQNQLIQIIDNKCIRLLNLTTLNGFQRQKVLCIYTPIENKKYCAYTHLYIECIKPTKHNNKIELPNYKKERLCLITDLDISMQKEDSFLLSHTGLKFYYKTDKKKYNEIRRKHLTQKWIGSSFKTEIREIAHNIRDTIQVQRKKQNKLYHSQQIQLFEIGVNFY